MKHHVQVYNHSALGTLSEVV